MRITIMTVLVAMLISSSSDAATTNAQLIGAQIEFHWIQGFGYSNSPKDPAVGGRYVYALRNFRWSLSGSYYFYGEDPSLAERLFDINADIFYAHTLEAVTAYGGGGLNITRYSAHGRTVGDITTTASFSNTPAALSLAGGAQFDVASRISLFV